MLALPRRAFGRGNLIERPADVNGSRASAGFGRPGNGRVERPIELAHAGTVTIPLEFFPVRLGQSVARHGEKLARRNVAENRARLRQVIYRLHRFAGDDFSAERPQVGRERVGDALRAAAGNRPACHVPGNGEDQSEGSRRYPFERQHRMRRQPGEERSRPFAAEMKFGESGCGAKSQQPEQSSGEWMARNARHPEQERFRPRPVLDQTVEHALVALGVWTKNRGGFIDGAQQNGGGAVVERMRQRDRRLDPREAVLLERQRAEERRDNGHGVHGRANVVEKSGKVSSPVRVPPPILSLPSITSTERPDCASVIAAARPFGPEPITTASYSAREGCSASLRQGRI